MPARLVPLVTGEIYHIVNRGNAATPIFKNKGDYQLFIRTLCYYQNSHPPFRFSKFRYLNSSERNKIIEETEAKKDFLVEIISYCLMPNHFHFLLKQTKDKGIIEFIRLLNNSYSRYFNTKYRRKGSLFEGRFKAIRVETDEQLLHLSRYIHLNPYSSFVVKDLNRLLVYPFSSLSEYLGKGQNSICSKEIVANQFKNLKAYQRFIFDQADYQRNLQTIKYQLLEV